MRFKIDSRKWFTALAACFAVSAIVLVFFPYWTWALFDELGWVSEFDRGFSVWDFVKFDYESAGRFRPLAPLIAYGRVAVFGHSAHWLRVERFAEFGLMFGATYLWLRKKEKLWMLPVAFALGFAVKAPPILELYHFMSLSELHGTLFVVLAILTRDRSKALSYALLCAATLTKEPYGFFIALPAILDREVRESVLALGASALYLFVLYAFRRGGYYEMGMTGTTQHELYLKLALDFSVLVPILVLGWKSFVRYPWKKKLLAKKPTRAWKALVLIAFSIAHSVVLAGKASGYTYHFAPGVLLVAAALALILQDVHEERPFSRATLLAIGVVCCLMPTRMVWNMGRLWLKQQARWEITEAIRTSGIAGPLGINCYLDRNSVGYVADRRKEDERCYLDNESLQSCCRRASLYGLLGECPNFDSRLEAAKRAGLPLLAAGKNWYLFTCRK